MRRSLRYLFLIAALCTSASGWSASSFLQNGLRYAIVPCNPGSNEVSVRLHVAVGSLDETPEERGYAHLVEHLVFMNEGHFSCDHFDSHLEGSALSQGIYANAYTADDRTVYELDLKLEEGAQLDDALRFFKHVLSDFPERQSSVDHEAAIVIEEERMRNSPGKRALYALAAGLYRGELLRPELRQEIEESTLSATAESLEAFFRKYYGPSRAVLLLMGDVDEEEARSLIEAQLSDCRDPEQLSDRDFFPRPFPRPVTATIIDDETAAHPTVKLLFSDIDQTAHPETHRGLRQRLAEDVALHILAKRLQGLAASKLKEAQFERGSWLANTSLSLLHLTCQVKDWKQSLEELIGLVRELEDSELGEVYVANSCLEVAAYLDFRRSYLMESKEDFAEAYLSQLVQDSEPYCEDPVNYLGAQVAILERGLSASEVQAALRSWRERCVPSTVLVLPNGQIGPSIDDLEAATMQAWAAESYVPAFIETHERLNELALKIGKYRNWVRNPDPLHKEVQKYSDSYSWLIAPKLSVFFVPRKLGAHEMRDVLLTFDLGDASLLPEMQIAEEILRLRLERWNSAMAAFDIETMCELTLDSLKVYIRHPIGLREPALALLRTILWDVQLRESEILYAKEAIAQTARLLRSQDLDAAVRIAATEARLGMHILPTEEAIAALSASELRNAYYQMLHFAPLRVVFSGDDQCNELVSLSQKALGDLGLRDGLELDAPEAFPTSTDVTLTVDAPGERAAVLIGLHVEGAAAPLLNRCASLIRSRLSQRLRYEEMLTYAVTSNLSGSPSSADLQYSCICHRDNAERVLEIMEEELVKLRDLGARFDEFVGLGALEGIPNWQIIQEISRLESFLRNVIDISGLYKVRVLTRSEAAHA